jgi:hypothetical protein
MTDEGASMEAVDVGRGFRKGCHSVGCVCVRYAANEEEYDRRWQAGR